MPAGDDTVAMLDCLRRARRRRVGRRATSCRRRAARAARSAAARRRCSTPPGRHHVALRHRGRRAGAGPGHDRRRCRRCGAGRWRRCTTRWSRSAPASSPASGGPPAGHRHRARSAHGRARCDLRGDVSSQYLTALMLIGPLPRRRPADRAHDAAGVAAVRRAHGRGDGRVRRRRRRRRRATRWSCRRAATGAPTLRHRARRLVGQLPAGDGRRRRWSRSTVAGLRRRSLQGDAAFADLLGAMGCTVSTTPSAASTVRRDPDGRCAGIDVDMADISDLVPTLAVGGRHCAARRRRSRGVGFIRGKESDRLGDLAAELRKPAPTRRRRADDGLRIEPADRAARRRARRPTTTIGWRWRSACSAAVVAGIEVDDPDVVSKSWPDFWRRTILADERRPATMVAVSSTCRPTPVVAAFDVDGTLTTRDCVVPFLRARRRHGPIAARLRPVGAPRRAAALARRDRDRLKALAAGAVFARSPQSAMSTRSATQFAGMVAASLAPSRHRRPGCAGTSDAGPRRRARVGIVRRLPAARWADRLGVDDVLCHRAGRRRSTARCTRRLRRRQLPRAGEGAPPRTRGSPSTAAGGRPSSCGPTATRPAIASCSPTPTTPCGSATTAAGRRRGAGAVTTLAMGLLRTARPQAVGEERPRVRRARARPACSTTGRTWATRARPSSPSAWPPAAPTSGTTSSTSRPTACTRRSASARSPPASCRSARPRSSARCCSSSASASPR